MPPLRDAFFLFINRILILLPLFTQLYFWYVLILFSIIIFFLQIITTPTKTYQLWSRSAPKLSPETGTLGSLHTQNSSKLDNDILNEALPPEMNEQALEAISEELRMVQVIFSFRKN